MTSEQEEEKREFYLQWRPKKFIEKHCDIRKSEGSEHKSKKYLNPQKEGAVDFFECEEPVIKRGKGKNQSIFR